MQKKPPLKIPIFLALLTLHIGNSANSESPPKAASQTKYTGPLIDAVTQFGERTKEEEWYNLESPTPFRGNLKNFEENGILKVGIGIRGWNPSKKYEDKFFSVFSKKNKKCTYQKNIILY